MANIRVTLVFAFLFLDYASAIINTVTDLELQVLSELILDADENNAAELVSINQQDAATDDIKDYADLPLLTVDPAAYEKPTIKKLISLFDNYVALVNEEEKVTAEETAEEKDFLDAIMSTKIMQLTEKFLVDEGLISPSSGDITPLRDAIHNVWFGLYTRTNGTLGSSGFERVFLGEIINGKVAGFHNWIFFTKEEQTKNLNYQGKVGGTVSLGKKGSVISHKYMWHNYSKEKSSMLVGTSPELELALYTVCFYTRPGAKCPVKLNGNIVNIISQNMFDTEGKRYVAHVDLDL